MMTSRNDDVAEVDGAFLRAQGEVSGPPKPPQRAARDPRYPVNVTDPKFSARSDNCDV